MREVALCMHKGILQPPLHSFGAGAVELPIPYHVPPRPHKSDDRPWCIEEDHIGKDRWGCVAEEC